MTPSISLNPAARTPVRCRCGSVDYPNEEIAEVVERAITRHAVKLGAAIEVAVEQAIAGGEWGVAVCKLQIDNDFAGSMMSVSSDYLVGPSPAVKYGEVSYFPSKESLMLALELAREKSE